MGSSDWWAWRKRWHAHWIATSGTDPVCTVCGKAWTVTNGDLHHRSYARLGTERFNDVIPMCRRCHDRLHGIYEGNPLWWRLGRARATDAIVTRLRATTTPHG
jgi:5-methylcytosine-specific restriction endonuclease McrA